MLRRKITSGSKVLVTAMLAMAAPLTVAASEVFPSRAITIIVPYAAGGSADAVARMIAARMAKRVGQPVIVDNRPGAGTLIGTSYVARAPADGYTVLFSASVLTIQPAINKSFNVDVAKDLAPVSEAVRGMFLIASSSKFSAKTLQEAIAYSKSHPDAVSFGTPGNGTSPHVTGEYLKAKTGAKFLHVPYKGSSLALNATLGNEVQFTIDPVFTLKPYVESGKLNALAVTGTKRSPMLPNVPTVAESGVPGFEVNYWMGFFAPAKTPASVVQTLSKEIKQAIQEPELKSQLEAQAFEPIGGTPDEFAKRVAAELALWKKVVEQNRLHVE